MQKVEKDVGFKVINLDNSRGIIYGVVLEPETDNDEGGYWQPDHIITAAHDYLRHFRRITLSHTFDIPSTEVAIVESYIAPIEFESEFEERRVKKGSWVVGLQILNDELRSAVATELIKGLSASGFVTFMEVGDE